MKEFLWMSAFTSQFLLRLPDGTVVLKSYGNASGSGVTTRDNIFGHIIIFASGLYSAYVEATGTEPSMEAVAEQIAALFGDDNVYAVDEEYSLMCDEDFLRRHLQKYGLKLKFFFGGLDADLSTLSFLGAHFKNISGNYLPCYDVERIATTMIYEKDRLNLGQHVQKAFTLMVMSYPTGQFDAFHSAYSQLVLSRAVQRSEDPICKSHAFLGAPEIHQIESFYLGGESAGVNDRFNFSLPLESISDVDSSTHTPTKYSHESYEPNDFAFHLPLNFFANHNHFKRVNEICSLDEYPLVIDGFPIAKSRIGLPLIDPLSSFPWYEVTEVRDYMHYLYTIRDRVAWREYQLYFRRDGYWAEFDPESPQTPQFRQRQFELFKKAHNSTYRNEI
jgi:hypothetical protein